MTTGELEGRTVLVTGAASGVGRACAELFATAGATVGLLDVHPRGMDEAVESIRRAGGVAHPRVCDVADAANTANAVAELTAAIGGAFDGVVAAAGISRDGLPQPLHEVPDRAWDRVLGVNVRGLVNVCRATLPGMMQNGRGSIIGLGSTYSFLGAPNLAPYAATKAAIVQVVRSIARDYGPHGIRANTIVPGWIDTPLLRTDVALSGDPEAVYEGVRSRAFLGRLGEPAEIAELASFLTSDRASYISGAVVVADGGYSAG